MTTVVTRAATAARGAILFGALVGAGCRSTAVDDGSIPASASTITAAANEPRSSLRPVASVERGPVADGILRAGIGDVAPDFELFDLDGRPQRLSTHRGKIVVLEWFNPKCPVVKYAYDEGPLSEMKRRYAMTGIVWLAINSNAPGQEGSEPDDNRAFLAQRRLTTPVLLDPLGLVGRTYGARTTPHVFVVNERGVLVYSGALDNAPQGRVESAAAKTNYVETAISDLRSGHAVTTSSTRPYGCSIKYDRL